MGARTNQRKKKMALGERDLCSVPGSSRKTEKKQRGKSEGAINGKGKQGSLYERWLLGDG